HKLGHIATQPLTFGLCSLTLGPHSDSKTGTRTHTRTLNASFCLGVSALWIVVIRFQQVRDYGHNSRVNIASIILGFISCLGISLIGNFQQSVMKEVHLLGAFLAFFVGLAYFWLQAWLCYRAPPSDDHRWVGGLRLTFCSISTILDIAMVTLHNTGYKSGAAISEWALVMSFFVLFGIFGCEFRHIDCHQLTVQKRGLKTLSTNGGDIRI
uniref:CWH43-like N-terminal domain-containing protein n=1 Tax=Esox lucius TaxID=8010 RepID=A0A3P8ZWL8_ESOLU